MAITHTFFSKDFLNGFQTHNAILDITPYKPEVMFVGTFNAGTPGQKADFFYGRNFFWPALKNLFFHNAVALTSRRMPTRGVPPAILNPTIIEVFELCGQLNLTFSDLILEVLHRESPTCEIRTGKVIFEGVEYNLTDDNHLQALDNCGQVHWNTQNIIEYLCKNPQIKQIYFTRKPVGIYASQWNLIINHDCMRGRLTTNIFTPSGAGDPVSRSMTRLLNHWIHNTNPTFGTLNNTWLVNKGVTLNNY